MFEWIPKGFVEDAAFTIGQNGDSAEEEPSKSLFLSLVFYNWTVLHID